MFWTKYQHIKTPLPPSPPPPPPATNYVRINVGINISFNFSFQYHIQIKTFSLRSSAVNIWHSNQYIYPASRALFCFLNTFGIQYIWHSKYMFAFKVYKLSFKGELAFNVKLAFKNQEEVLKRNFPFAAYKFTTSSVLNAGSGKKNIFSTSVLRF